METSCRANGRVSRLDAGVGSGSARLSQMVASPPCSISGGLVGVAAARLTTHFFVAAGTFGRCRRAVVGAGVGAAAGALTASAGAGAASGASDGVCRRRLRGGRDVGLDVGIGGRRRIGWERARPARPAGHQEWPPASPRLRARSPASTRSPPRAGRRSGRPRLPGRRRRRRTRSCRRRRARGAALNEGASGCGAAAGSDRSPARSSAYARTRRRVRGPLFRPVTAAKSSSPSGSNSSFSVLLFRSGIDPAPDVTGRRGLPSAPVSVDRAANGFRMSLPYRQPL